VESDLLPAASALDTVPTHDLGALQLAIAELVAESPEVSEGNRASHAGGRVIPLLKKPWPKGENGWIPCPVCGQPWRPWAGSYLPCHARCLFDDDEERAIKNDPRSTRVIANELGVTESVIRSVGRR
jgi:hypothetical protein